MTRFRQQWMGWMLLIFCAIVLTAQTLTPINAQAGTLSPFIPVEGNISEAGGTETWRFTALEGAMISLWVQPDASTLDPVISLANSNGTVLLANDDLNYPDQLDALLQGVTLPRTDTYSVTVSGYEQSTGAYLLTLFSGYPNQVFADNFDATTTRYEPSRNALSFSESESRLTLSIDGVNEPGYVYDEDGDEYTDFYAQALFNIEIGRNGWETGLVIRHTSTGHYTASVNHRGQWRILFTDDEGTERTIRDWTNHPAIRAGESTFTLGVLAHGAGFDVFYNDAYVGQAVDREQPALGGVFGFYVRSAGAVGSATTAHVDNFIVTAPLQLTTDDGESADIVPDQLMPGSLGLTIQELERRRVIPVGGMQALNVPSSSGVEVNPGVNRILLARGTTFSNMVLSTTFTRTSVPDGIAGCGLLFGSTGEDEHALAFLDSSGAYGLSVLDGLMYQQGIFNESDNPSWRDGRQHLLVVVVGDRVEYFVNRRHVGTLDTPLMTGEVGNAVVNYDPVNTTCNFSDTWVWSLP